MWYLDVFFSQLHYCTILAVCSGMNVRFVWLFSEWGWVHSLIEICDLRYDSLNIPCGSDPCCCGKRVVSFHNIQSPSSVPNVFTRNGLFDFISTRSTCILFSC